MRKVRDEEIIVILNNSTSPWSVKIPVNDYLGDSKCLTCLLSKKTYAIKEGHIVGPDLDSKNGAILLVEKE